MEAAFFFSFGAFLIFGFASPFTLHASRFSHFSHFTSPISLSSFEYSQTLVRCMSPEIPIFRPSFFEQVPFESVVRGTRQLRFYRPSGTRFTSPTKSIRGPQMFSEHFAVIPHAFLRRQWMQDADAMIEVFCWDDSLMRTQTKFSSQLYAIPT
jgi:hypothetical protein